MPFYFTRSQWPKGWEPQTGDQNQKVLRASKKNMRNNQTYPLNLTTYNPNKVRKMTYIGFSPQTYHGETSETVFRPSLKAVLMRFFAASYRLCQLNPPMPQRGFFWSAVSYKISNKKNTWLLAYVEFDEHCRWFRIEAIKWYDNEHLELYMHNTTSLVFTGLKQ